MPRPVKRSFTIGGHRTSISLEAPFWEALREIATREKCSLAQLVQSIDVERDDDGGLSSSVRIWILNYFRRGPAEVPRMAPKTDLR
ncbi:MAG: ribbon-helix-helix domain-containing protein [Hyphomicrobiaceae bacterium]